MPTVRFGSVFYYILFVYKPFGQIAENRFIPFPMTELRRRPVGGAVRCKSSGASFSVFAQGQKGMIANCYGDNCLRLGNGLIITQYQGPFIPYSR